MKKTFQFVDYLKATKQERNCLTEVLEILDEIFKKYSRSLQLFYQTKRDSRSASKYIVVLLYFEDCIIDDSVKRKAIKSFIKVLINIENTSFEFDLANYKIISINDLLANSFERKQD